MSGSPDADRVKIPAVFIGLTDGHFINTTFLYTIDDNVTIIIDGKTSDINWLDRYVWPFLGSVVFVFLLLAAFSVYKVIPTSGSSIYVYVRVRACGCVCLRLCAPSLSRSCFLLYRSFFLSFSFLFLFLPCLSFFPVSLSGLSFFPVFLSLPSLFLSRLSFLSVSLSCLSFLILFLSCLAFFPVSLSFLSLFPVALSLRQPLFSPSLSSFPPLNYNLLHYYDAYCVGQNRIS